MPGAAQAVVVVRDEVVVIEYYWEGEMGFDLLDCHA